MSRCLAIALSVYLLVAAVWDLRTLRVPNWLTLPALAGVLVWRLVQLDGSFLTFWAGCLIAWHVNALGGGDAKLLMVLFGLFPEVELFYLLLAVAGVVLAVVVIWRRVRSQKLKAFLSSLGSRLVTLRLFPPPEEVEAQGDPFAFLISLAGVVYVWTYGGGWH